MSMTYQVTNNYDYGDGSLRNILEQCVDGDKIVFNETAFPEGSTSVLTLVEPLTINNEVTIDATIAGSSSSVLRVAIDGSDTMRLADVTDNVTFKGISFVNGKNEDKEGVVNVVGSRTVAFENCSFKNNDGGCVSSPSSTTLTKATFTNCSFQNNVNGTCKLNAGTVQFTNCSFNANTGTVTGTSVNVQNYNSVEIVNSTFTSESSPVYLRKGSSANTTLTNCQINGNVDSDDLNLVLNGTIIDGALTCNALTVKNQNYVDVIAGNYAKITFDNTSEKTSLGVETIPASGELNGTGYFAKPTSVSVAGYTKSANVVICAYGCGISSVSSQVTDVLTTIRWQGTNLNIPILIEKKVGSKWEVQTTEAVGGCWEHGTIPAGKTYAFRLFDGINWKELEVSRLDESGTTEDSEHFTNNNENGSGTLRDTIDDAEDGSVISPDPDSWEEGEDAVLNLSETLVIDKNISLVGTSRNRIVIVATNAANAAVKIDYECDYALIENVDFIGRVESYGKSVTFKNCRFFHAQNGSGALVNYRSDDIATITLQNCVVANNKVCGVYAGSAGCVLSLVNCTLVGNENCDLKANGSSSITRLYNSIVGTATLNVNVVNQSSVTNVSVETCGFVSYTPTTPSNDAASITLALRMWNFGLSETSPYITSGSSKVMTSKDFKGIVRGSYVENPEPSVACSLGAFERIKADLYWIGKDSSGNAVSNPSFNSADGWADSIDATEGGDVAPTASNSLYIASNATFGDNYKGKAIALAEGVTCVLNGSNETSVDTSVILKDNSTLKVGSNEKINIKMFYCGTGAKLVANGDFSFEGATINSELNLEEGSTLNLLDSALNLASLTVDENTSLILTDCDVNIDELTVNGTLILNNCRTTGSAWNVTDSGTLKVIEGSYSVYSTTGTTNATVLFSKASTPVTEINAPKADVTYENQNINVETLKVKNVSIEGGSLNVTTLETKYKLTTVDAALNGNEWNVAIIDLDGGSANVSKVTVSQLGSVKLANATGNEWTGEFVLYVGNNKHFDVQTVKCSYFVVEGGYLTSKNVEANQSSTSTNGVLGASADSVWYVKENLTLTNSVTTVKEWRVDGLLTCSGGTLDSDKIQSSTFNATNANIDCQTFVNNSTCSIASTSAVIVKLNALTNATLNLVGSESAKGTLEVETLTNCDVNANYFNLAGNVWSLGTKTLTLSNCSVDVDSLAGDNGSLANVTFDCDSITLPNVDLTVEQNVLQCATLNVKKLTSNGKTLKGTNWTLQDDFVSTNDRIEIETITVNNGKSAILTNPQINFDSASIVGFVELTLNEQNLDCEALTLKKLVASNCSLDCDLLELTGNAVVTNVNVKSDNIVLKNGANVTMEGGKLEADSVVKDSENSVVVCSIKDADCAITTNFNVKEACFSVVNKTLNIGTLVADSVDFTSSTLTGSNWTLNKLQDFNDDMENIEIAAKSVCNVTALEVTTFTGKKESTYNGSVLNIKGNGSFDNVNLQVNNVNIARTANVALNNEKNNVLKEIEVQGKFSVDCANFTADKLTLKANSETNVNVQSLFKVAQISQEESSVFALNASKYQGSNWILTSALNLTQFESFNVDSVEFGKNTVFNGANTTGTNWTFNDGSNATIQQDSVTFTNLNCGSDSTLNIIAKNCSVAILTSNGTSNITANEGSLQATNWNLKSGTVKAVDSVVNLSSITFNSGGSLIVEDATSGSVNNVSVGNSGKINITSSVLTLGTLSCGTNGIINVDGGEELVASNISANNGSNVTLKGENKINVGNLECLECQKVEFESKALNGSVWKLGSNSNVTFTESVTITELDLQNTAKFNAAGGTGQIETFVTQDSAEFNVTNGCVVNFSNFESIGNNSNVKANVDNESGIITDAFSFNGIIQITLNNDSFFSIKESVSKSGSCSIKSANKGYLAVKPDMNASFATLENVVVCDYGANVQTVKTTSDSISWTRSESGNNNAGVLLEKQDDSGKWETIENKFMENSYSITTNETAFRVFDGEKFKYDSFWSLNSSLWQVVSDVVTAEGGNVTGNIIQGVNIHQAGSETEANAKPGQEVSVLARITNVFGNKTLCNNGSNVKSVKYSCVRYKTGLFDSTEYPVDGHTDVTIDSSCVLDSIQTNSVWQKDSLGFNFVFSPNTTIKPIFPVSGSYQICVTITLNIGNPIVFYVYVNVK